MAIPSNSAARLESAAPRLFHSRFKLYNYDVLKFNIKVALG